MLTFYNWLDHLQLCHAPLEKACHCNIDKSSISEQHFYEFHTAILYITSCECEFRRRIDAIKHDKINCFLVHCNSCEMVPCVCDERFISALKKNKKIRTKRYEEK